MKEIRNGSLPPTTSENFVKRSIRFAAKKALPMAMAGSIALAGCHNDQDKGTQSEATPKTSENISLPSNPLAIFSLPFHESEDMNIQQGWIYTNFTNNNGSKDHKGIDFIKGKVDNSSTWESFDVLASADGYACANPLYREGDTVFMEHVGSDGHIAGYSYYGHLKEHSADIPDCSTQGKIFEHRGDKIGEAGSDGTNDPSWIHLHFQVNKIDGSSVDPYGINGERNSYPKTDFSDIKEKPCGEQALFLDCYSSKTTVVESKTTPTPENMENNEGVLSMGDWQFEVKDWKESNYQQRYNYLYGKQENIYREGWKYVTVEGQLRNTGTTLSDSPDLENLYFLSKDNNEYETEPHTLSHKLPPGFSNKASVEGWVPQNQSDYAITYDALQDEQSYRIKKGEVSQNQPNISLDVEKNDINKPWSIPNFGDVKYSNKTVTIQGDRLEDYVYSTGKYRIYQYVSLSLQNNTGQDISSTSLTFLIFSKDGDIITGQRATKGGLEPPIVAPGLKKPFYIYLPIGTTENPQKIDNKIEGGVLVGIKDNNWFAWQLP